MMARSAIKTLMAFITILGIAGCAGSNRDDNPGHNTGFYGGVNFGR